MKNVLRNAKSALENAKNGKTSELERNLETLGNYLEDMESVLSGGKGDGVVRKDGVNETTTSVIMVVVVVRTPQTSYLGRVPPLGVSTTETVTKKTRKND